MKSFVAAFVVGLCLIVVCSCSGDKPRTDAAAGVTIAPSSNSSPSSPAPSNSDNQGSQVDVCSFFSAADAQSIFGVPMKRSDKTNPKRNCMYEEVKARPNTIGAGTVTLTLNQQDSADKENKDWAQLKEVRHLEAGQKNVKALTGIGDEAWFTGNTEKGKVGVAAVIVRKGKSDFALDSMVLEYIASPEAMKSVAKRVADRVQ